MDIGRIYLSSVLENFSSMKATAERALSQLDFNELQAAPTVESNSIGRIVKHMSGNMVSRWTDFLTSDGEKPTRDRDSEFEGGYLSIEELMADWNVGWERLFDAVGQLEPDDLSKVVHIRAEPHNVIKAIERQVAHLSYHVGQIVYIAKQIRNSEWESLSIPKGKSQEYLDRMNKRFGQDNVK